MQSPPDPAHTRIAIIGLGYVGLPLAVEFGKQYDTVGSVSYTHLTLPTKA